VMQSSSIHTGSKLYGKSYHPFLIAFSFPFGCSLRELMSPKFAVDVSRVHIVIITGCMQLYVFFLSAIVFGFI
jgi:hypothetical protein